MIAAFEGGEGAGKDFVTMETLQYIERHLAKATKVAQVLTLLEQGKTDKAATGWEIVIHAQPAEE